MTTSIDAAPLLTEVEERLSVFLDAATVRAARHSPRYQDLWRHLRSALRGGKRLRPRLLLASHLHFEGRATRAAVDAAAATELLHTALLLHDDVIDGDTERRGAPNLAGSFSTAAMVSGLPAEDARRWGESAAILAGDLLLTAALRAVAGLKIDQESREVILDLFDESIFRAAAGELDDVAYSAGLDVPTAADIRDMMANKTAHYSLELPLRSGAILAGAAADAVDQLGAIGRSLGLLFQMRDDLLGVFGDSAETGKSTSNDLREGKQTMLVAHARTSELWADTAEAFGDDALTEGDAQRIRDTLVRSGARELFEEEIRRERDAAIALIVQASVPAGLADFLILEARSGADRRS